MHRYSERLDKAKVLSALEEIRASFFGPEAKQKCNIYSCIATIN